MNQRLIHPGMMLAGSALLLLITFVTMTGCNDTPAPIARGHASYDAYCQSCHGTDGKGNGQIATILNNHPANLTHLAVRNHGTFPIDLVYNTIDGRDVSEAHGTREMPIWGNIWSDKDGTPIEREIVDQRINELVEYIRTLQETS